jgi:hypothetical protein
MMPHAHTPPLPATGHEARRFAVNFAKLICCNTNAALNLRGAVLAIA